MHHTFTEVLSHSVSVNAPTVIAFLYAIFREFLRNVDYLRLWVSMPYDINKETTNHGGCEPAGITGL
jgi:hypothetical protein